jgi:hypothetical protein
MKKDTFDVLLLNARPAAGKSEIIDYLKRCDLQSRKKRFHIGEFEEIDDFPMLWTWFEEDEILEEMGLPRLHSDEAGYFKEQYLWNLLIRRMSLAYQKRADRIPNYHDTTTTIIEFARGTEHGGYKSAYQHLDKQIVERMVILYLDVSYEESLRKNQKRFNPERPDSILEHGLSDEKMERLYKNVDWHDLAKNDPAYIEVQGVQVPYVIFDNADDVTTGRGEALGERLEECLTTLWQRWSTRPPLK